MTFKLNFRAILLSLAILIANQIQAQDVAPTWESLKQRGYPQWFSDAKLGIFIHWGLYSVPSFASEEGYGEWYYRGIMTQDSARLAFQKETYGEDFTYRDFDKLFKAELFDAQEWADLFERSGAKYVLLVTKHHDGYCLWDSKFAPYWNSVNGGPKRNIVAELTESVRKKGLKMGFYYSLPEWTNPLHIWMQDPNDSISEYVDKHMIPQFKELVSTYKPSIIFADGEWFNSAKQWHAAELISWYYNTVGDDAIVNDRWGSGSDYGFRTPEYSAGITQTDRPWAECRGLGRSFGLNRNEPLGNYMTSETLIRHFVKLVAAGGGMTLNVGPAADGQIPLLQQERLIDLGKWLKINGEAIYATRPYTKFYEEKDVEVARIDSTIDFNWVRNSPDPQISYDNFTAKWSGYIVPKYSEEYTFEVEVDDNAQLIINKQEIINYNPKKAEASESNAQEANNFRTSSGKIKLIAGKSYSVEVNYQEINTEARMRLFWSSKTQPKGIVDTFFTDQTLDEKGLRALYACEQPYVCYTQNEDALYALALEYPQDSLILQIDKPNNDATIQLLGCQKPLPWRYEGGKVIIDTTPLKYNDLKSSSVWVFKISKD